MKAAIIFNPEAGTRSLQTQIREAGKYLERQGWQITWRQTAYAGHATQLAKEAADRTDDVAVAVGGDGTINEVVNGLVGSETALGVIPAGTGNVFAVEMHIPIPGPLAATNSLKKASKVLANGQMRRVDVAQARFVGDHKRYFLLWAGVGIDAAISKALEVDKSHRPVMRTLGLAAWLIAGLSVLRDFRGKRMWVTVDQGRINRRMILTTISNSQLYGRFWRLSPEAKLDDGLLDVVAMEGYGLTSSIKHVVQATLGRHTKDPEVHIFRTRRVKIETRAPMPVQVDAENIGYTPVEIEVIPGALKIILPQNAPHYLFQNVASRIL